MESGHIYDSTIPIFAVWRSGYCAGHLAWPDGVRATWRTEPDKFSNRIAVYRASYFLRVIGCICDRFVSGEKVGFDCFIRPVSIPVRVYAFIIRLYYGNGALACHAEFVSPTDLRGHDFGVRSSDLFSLASQDA